MLRLTLLNKLCKNGEWNFQEHRAPARSVICRMQIEITDTHSLKSVRETKQRKNKKYEFGRKVSIVQTIKKRHDSCGS